MPGARETVRTFGRASPAYCDCALQQRRLCLFGACATAGCDGGGVRRRLSTNTAPHGLPRSTALFQVMPTHIVWPQGPFWWACRAGAQHLLRLTRRWRGSAPPQVSTLQAVLRCSPPLSQRWIPQLLCGDVRLTCSNGPPTKTKRKGTRGTKQLTTSSQSFCTCLVSLAHTAVPQGPAGSVALTIFRCQGMQIDSRCAALI